MQRFAASLALAFLCVTRAFAATPMIAAGTAHGVVLKSDGTVSTWGSNQSGQLGDGQRLFAKSPARVAGLPAIASVSAGDFHVLALAKNGTVWAWGSNAYAQLGDGTHDRRSTAAAVPGLTGVTKVSAGAYHSLALLSDGTVMQWGANLTRLAGVSDAVDRSKPTAVAGLVDIVAISAGANHSLAMRKDGVVFAWGANTFGEIDGAFPSVAADQAAPKQVPGLPSIGSIAAVGATSYAVATNGWVYWWGELQQLFPPAGKIGGPARLNQLTDVASVAPSACSRQHTVFISTTGKALAYRDGAEVAPAGLILPDPFNALTIGGLGPVMAAATGGESFIVDASAPSGGLTTTLLMQDGSIYAWGNNAWGQLGNGTSTNTLTPTRVPGIDNAVGVSSGNAFTVAVTDDGAVWVWGQNENGELADGTPAATALPRSVNGLSAISSVSTSSLHTLALAADGSVWAWGGNQSAEVGTGQMSGAESSPLKIGGLASVTAVAAGTGFSLALKTDGTVWSWGTNAIGQLGRTSSETGSTAGVFSAKAAAQIPNFPDAKALAAGAGFGLAIKTDGTVWIWGSDLEVSGATALTIPRKIAAFENAVAISAGSSSYAHALVLTSDGSVWSFGSNQFGQLGNGLSAIAANSQPAKVVGMPPVASISAGNGYSTVIDVTGAVWAWGVNTSGQLGDGTTNLLPSPTLVRKSGLTTAVAAGTGATLALTSTGLLLAWGDNSGGLLGDGTLVSSYSGVVVVREGGVGNTTTNDWFLDPSPVSGKTVTAALVPPMLLNSIASGTDQDKQVRTTIKFRPADVGTTGGIFITARVPPGTLSALATVSAQKTAQRSTRGPSAVADPATYELVQRTSTGWLSVANGQLIPYASGVFNDTLATQTVFTGINTTKIPGAQFCIGYGKDAPSMVAAGTMRAVASVANGPVGVNCVPASASVIPQSGVWWNPAEGGRGYTIEHKAGRVFMAAYLYDSTGRSNWYGAGPAAMAGSVFSAPLTAYSGGQTLTGAWKAPVQGTSPGDVSITFTDATHATLTWPGGAIPIERYEFAANGLKTPPTATQPETGWWWNPAEGGRGFSVEVQSGNLFVATYMYDSAGKPVWYASGPASLAGNTFQGNWSAYTGGQTLTGSYKSPTGNSTAGSLTVQFMSTFTGQLYLPDGRQIAIQRFSF